MNESASPTSRFSDRVENYVKARPAYPPEVVAVLQRECGLTPLSTIVDIGCGTGLLAKLFCEFGCTVLGVEPNEAMRRAGEEFLHAYAKFSMADGAAEAIPAGDASADFITAGQAFHWFDIDRAREEFRRVLKPDGWAVLIWNDRLFTGSPFAEAYEQMLVEFGTDYAAVNHRGKTTLESFERFFGHGDFRRANHPNSQRLDRDGFMARILSSSYMPGPQHVQHAAMLRRADEIFAANAREGLVVIDYTTSMYYGRIKECLRG